MPVLSNHKHERFAQALAKGKSAHDAYQIAGYVENDGNASRLKGNDKVAERVLEIQGKAAEKVIASIEDISRQLDEDRDFARQQGSPGAAVSATMGKAKLLGHLTDKVRHEGPGGGPLEITWLTPEG